MMVTLRDINTFEPTIGKCKEAEPPLREILMQYYVIGGGTREHCYKLADEYIRKLKDHLNEEKQ
jgi:hypothetical protein